jgi:NAD(P)-dependent dehydrogenase (short-subunit alcohol dehydrogenase family)
MSALAERVVVITGAGSGIGRAGAEAFAAAGAVVHVADVDAERVEATTKALVDTGASAVGHVVDVTDADQVDRLAADVYRDHDRVDVVWNNAGIGFSGSVADTTNEQWRRVVEVNLLGVTNGVTAFVPRLIDQGGDAHVLSTASGLGLVPSAGVAPYAATKAAVVAMTESIAPELAEHRIAATAICPGVIDTAIIGDTTFAGDDGESNRAKAQKFFSRGAKPEQVAADTLRCVLRGPVGRAAGVPGGFRLPGADPVICITPISHVAPMWAIERLAPGVVARLSRRLPFLGGS